MNRTPVNSSNLVAVGFDPSTSTLEVEFQNGSLYQYFDVPMHVYNELLSASSIGQYFSNAVRGHYRYGRS